MAMIGTVGLAAHPTIRPMAAPTIKSTSVRISIYHAASAASRWAFSTASSIEPTM